MQRVDIDIAGSLLHVFNVHLGTAILERRYQARRLEAVVTDRHVTGPKIVLGDFNEWTKGLTTSVLSTKLKSVDLVEHLLDVHLRELVLRQADGGFHQGKLVIALHQGGEVIQGRGQLQLVIHGRMMPSATQKCTKIDPNNPKRCEIHHT